MSDIEQRLAELELRQRAHGEVLAALEGVTTTMHGLSETVAELVLKVGLTKVEKTPPRRNPRWHDLKPGGEEMAAELHRLKGFVKHIAVPLLGARRLPACMFEHMPAVLMIDAACELYRVLWLSEERTHAMVAQQADYLTRVLPALVASIDREVNGCQHQNGLAGLPSPRRVTS